MRLFLLFILLPYIGFSNAPEEVYKKELFHKNRRAKYPVGVSLVGFGASGIAGASLDWFFVPNFNLEVGAGINDLKSFEPVYFAGLKHHFVGKSILNTSLYLGLFDKVTIDASQTMSHELYVPLGVQRIKKNKFMWMIEGAYTYDMTSSKSAFYGGLKLGYRFNRLSKKKK